MLWNLHPYQSIGVTWSKIISSACTDPIASLSGLWKCFSICVIQVTLIYFYFFPSYHIWLFRTATFRPRFLARGKASEEPTEGVVSKLWKITLKAYFFLKANTSQAETGEVILEEQGDLFHGNQLWKQAQNADAFAVV